LATTLSHRVHRQIGRAIGEKLLSFTALVDPLVQCIQDNHRRDDLRHERESKLVTDERALLQQQARLLRLATSTDDPPSALIDQLKEIERELAETRAWLQELRDEAVEERPELTREQVLETLSRTADQLLTMSPEVRPILERLIPDKIRAVPYLQFGSTSVVLRAEFELQLVNLLPDRLLRALQGGALDAGASAAPIRMSVDLFEPSTVPANAMRALALHEDEGLTGYRISQVLNISKRNAYLAIELGEAMRGAGLANPYVRLTEPPVNAARWRLDPRFLPPTRSNDGEAA
jgi:hypothetical protein